MTRDAPVAIHDLGPAAAGLLAELHALCFDRPWAESDFTALLASPGTVALVAERSGEPAGLAVGRVVLDEAEVLTIGVVPAARRHGLGRVLMAALTARLHAAGARQLHLEVSEINRPASALYHDLGFVVTGRRRGYYADGSTAITMMRLLGPA
ncbi:ribosomal protein S18-alanine N-acetyltransferase [Zavarzinia sp. CC-PAN008]|uniref:ribosomal protein S18-alanine N-acetyltransferase n=1 Tax=Zavarzinia sp. CC-PAN008 TaxID=3243332 RepID=UPI003F746301